MLLLKNLLFTVLVPGTVAVYVPLLLASGRPTAYGFAQLLGAALLVVGASIYASCVWDFATSGRGTPAPLDAPKHLVVRGLYRYSRNPMYVGVLTVIFGCAALYLSSAIAIYGLAVATAFHLVVVFYEERTLAAQFGRQYDEYRSQVARWLPLARRNRPGGRRIG